MAIMQVLCSQLPACIGIFNFDLKMIHNGAQYVFSIVNIPTLGSSIPQGWVNRRV